MAWVLVYIIAVGVFLVIARFSSEISLSEESIDEETQEEINPNPSPPSL